MATSTVSPIVFLEMMCYTDIGPAILLYNDAQRKKAEAVVHRMVKRAVEMEGTVTVSSEMQDLLSA